LVAYAGRFYDFLQQMAASATIDEIAVQLRLMRETLARLGSLAQGRVGRKPMVESPKWFVRESEDPERREIERFLRAQNHRTPALQPLLQDHVSMVFGNDYNKLTDEEARDKELRKIEQLQSDFVMFFEQVPEIIYAPQKRCARK
jgi:hypothetical protein